MKRPLGVPEQAPGVLSRGRAGTANRTGPFYHQRFMRWLRCLDTNCFYVSPFRFLYRRVKRLNSASVQACFAAQLPWSDMTRRGDLVFAAGPAAAPPRRGQQDAAPSAPPSRRVTGRSARLGGALGDGRESAVLGRFLWGRRTQAAPVSATGGGKKRHTEQRAGLSAPRNW